MPTTGDLTPRAPWKEFRTTRRDSDRADPKALAEILGLAQGFCRGRGGSIHLRWAEAGALGTNAIVGGGVPMAAGAAWAHRRAGTGDVVVTCFGDGAVDIGSVLERAALAGPEEIEAGLRDVRAGSGRPLPAADAGHLH